MFVFSCKATTLKYVGVMVFCAAMIGATVFFVPDKSNDLITSAEYEKDVETIKPKDVKNIKSNDDRVKFLESYGLSIDGEAVEIMEVTIPKEFDEVYEKYNEIQKSSGFNLEKYKGKSAKKYTYKVTNYDYDGSVFASLIVYKNKVIGGDVSSADVSGFMHGIGDGEASFE